MGEKPSPYNQLLQIVAEAQEEKGEGGCFAEIYHGRGRLFLICLEYSTPGVNGLLHKL